VPHPSPSSGSRLRTAISAALAVLWSSALLGVSLWIALPAAGQVMPGQLNTELYGRGLGSVRQSGLAALGNKPWNMGALPSEYRHDVVLSGRLRSEIRGEYLARGPLAPGGIQSYIPVTPLPYGPYGSVRPYSTNPRPVAALPSGLASGTWTGSAVASLPTPYTGVLRGASTPSGGTLRPPTLDVRWPSEPMPTGVKPPLIGLNYGVLRGARPTPVRLQPGLVIPPPVPASDPSPSPEPSP
jgi:hypothetical protein